MSTPPADPLADPDGPRGTQPALRMLVFHPDADYLKLMLERRFPEIEVLAALPGRALPALAPRADALVGFARSVTAQLVASMPRLRWVQALSSGTDGFDAVPHGALLTSMHGIHGPAVSEMVLMQMFTLSRDFPRLLDDQRAQRWERRNQPLLHGKTVVIFGTGVIAAELARKCQALHQHTIGISAAPREVAGFDEVLERSQMLAAVSRADFLVALVPLDASTRHSIGAEVFAAMRPSAYFIDVARGGVCDEDALLQALSEGRIAGAALDVFATEPLPPGHPLWTAPRLLITPHLGGESDRYADQVLPIIERNIACQLQGRPGEMVNLVTRNA